MWRKIGLLIGVIAILFLSIGACASEELGEQQRREAIYAREQSFERAEAQIPAPIPTNFLARKMLVKFVNRLDTPDLPFYIYVLGENGNVIGYYVSQAIPVNICAFITSTEKIYSSSSGNIKLTAPSYDGIYYGGAGASSGCDGWFIFDSATDALIIIYGRNLFVASQPLALEAKPITVQIQRGEK